MTKPCAPTCLCCFPMPILCVVIGAAALTFTAAEDHLNISEDHVHFGGGNTKVNTSSVNISSDSSVFSVALFSIPAVGHVNPLFALAEELVRRGWTAVIVTDVTLEPFFHDSKLDGVRFASLPCGDLWRQSRTKLRDYIDEHPDFWDSIHYGIQSHLEDVFWDCLYEHGEKVILSENIDLMVVDASTFAGLDIAEKLQKPYVVNNPALIDIHDTPDCMPPAHYLPGVLSGKSIFETGAASRLSKAVMYPLMQLAQNFYIYSQFHRPFNTRRMKAGFPPREYRICPKDKLILVQQVLGVEYPRSVLPLMQFVGHLQRPSFETPLVSTELEWLEGEQHGKHSQPVIYVSFGTVFRLNSKRANVLLDGLSSDSFKVLWSLKSFGGVNVNHSLISSNVRIVPWVSSQLRILGHPNVHAFISHCGDNSLYEAIKMGTPLLCIPIAFDQLDCAMRGFDAGVARVLDKQSFTAEDIHREIQYILQNQSQFQSSLRRAQDLLKLAGGVTRAADLVEHVHTFGTEHLVASKSNDYLWQTYDWDILVIHASFTVAAIALMKFCFRCCCKCFKPKGKRD